jgi:hypothetical protein
MKINQDYTVMTLGHSARRPRGELVAMCFRDVPLAPPHAVAGDFPGPAPRSSGRDNECRIQPLTRLPLSARRPVPRDVELVEDLRGDRRAVSSRGDRCPGTSPGHAVAASLGQVGGRDVNELVDFDHAVEHRDTLAVPRRH